MFWLSKLHEERILDVRWITGADNETDIQMKNEKGTSFNKYCKVYCGKDKYGTRG